MYENSVGVTALPCLPLQTPMDIITAIFVILMQIYQNICRCSLIL